MRKIIENKRAFFDYEIFEKYLAGIELFGFEVKSIKKGRISIENSFVILKGTEVFLLNTFVPPYQVKNTPKDYDPSRKRKLLLKKREVRKLIGKSKEKGLTLIPLAVYNLRGQVKIEIALAKTKKKIDKKEKIKERDLERETKRELKEWGW